MSERQKSAGLAFWAIVTLLVLVVLWPLSWGPYFWFVESGHLPRSLRRVERIYDPLRLMLDVSPQSVNDLADQYLNWWYDGVALPEPWRPTSSR
jgi:hypothetical protein